MIMIMNCKHPSYAHEHTSLEANDSVCILRYSTFSTHEIGTPCNNQDASSAWSHGVGNRGVPLYLSH